MKKRKFLAPLTVSLAALIGSGVAVANVPNTDAESVSSIQSQVISPVTPIAGEDFVIHRNTAAETETANHRSHYSHRSHSSHQSHFSSYQ